MLVETLEQKPSMSVKPVFKVCRIDETKYYTNEELIKKAGKIWAVFIYDSAAYTRCCEITPSYELHYVYSTTEHHLTDEDDELLTEANIHRELVEYNHVHNIEAFSEDDNVLFSNEDEDTYENEDDYEERVKEVIEYEFGNWSF